MPIRRGTTLFVTGIAAILFVALILAVSALISVDRYRPQVISYLQGKTGKHVEIGRLALTFFPVGIHIDHLGVKNPPLFPAGYVLQVARIDAELSAEALLHRQVVIKSLVLEDPVLNLTSDPDGPWNFENLNPRSLLPPETSATVMSEIGTLNAYDPYIGGMGMPASIPSGHEFRVRAGRADIWVSPKRRRGNTCSAGIRHFSESRVIRISESRMTRLCPDPCRTGYRSDTPLSGESSQPSALWDAAVVGETSPLHSKPPSPGLAQGSSPSKSAV